MKAEERRKSIVRSSIPYTPCTFSKVQTGNSPRQAWQQSDDSTEFCTQSDLRIGEGKNILSDREMTKPRARQKGSEFKSFAIFLDVNLANLQSNIRVCTGVVYSDNPNPVNQFFLAILASQSRKRIDSLLWRIAKFGNRLSNTPEPREELPQFGENGKILHA